MDNLKGLVGVVSHDAGGAEVVAAYLSSREHQAILALKGPAISVFERHFGHQYISSISEAISRADWILTSTGWQSNHEWIAVRDALSSGKKVVAFLDNWDDYRYRFWRDGETALPNEIWVIDFQAKLLAEQAFPNTLVRLVPVPELSNTVRDAHNLEIEKRGAPESGSVLFLSDNMNSHTPTIGPPAQYSDQESLVFLMNNLDFVKGVRLPIRIRLHPSERIENYDWALSTFGTKLRVSKSVLLAEDLASHEIIVGSNSAAMVHAVKCGKGYYVAWTKRAWSRRFQWRGLRCYEICNMRARARTMAYLNI